MDFLFSRHVQTGLWGPPRGVFFLKRFIAQTVCAEFTRIIYKIVPATSWNKYLHCGTSGTE